MNRTPRQRAESFARDYGLQIPILMAPMAGACPPELAISVANVGGMGACGALLMAPDQIADWARQMRRGSNGAFQMNLWIPDPEPARDRENEAQLREFLAQWGPRPQEEAADTPNLDFKAQCEGLLAAGPNVVSSIMGVYPPDFVAQLKERNIKWFATATTVKEARLAAEAGADVIVAQGMEAGGHRGSFDAADAEAALVGLFSLLPAIVDAVSVPVVATGGIADGRGVAAALTLGAAAVQIGTGLLRTPEAATHPVWADAIARTSPEETLPTRAFSGRLGRSIATRYVRKASQPNAPRPAPYPIQRNLTAFMRGEGARDGNLDQMQVWAGQSAALASDKPAGELLGEIWEDAVRLLAT